MTRIGVSPLLWANDDMPELGGDTPVETILDGARDAGYEGVEIGHAFPREPEALRALLEPRGLKLASGWYGSRLLERKCRRRAGSDAASLRAAARTWRERDGAG